MKNFTNNFKQFTSRLSARWLIMALMLLAGTSSAWAAKVYFQNNKSWTDIKIYYWGGTAESIAWDGSKSMTSTGDKINGYDVYSYDFGDKAPDNIIFRGSDKQTVDITYSANTCWQLGTESGGKYSVSVVTYTPSQSATFSFSLPNELYVGTPADITYTLSPNAAGTVSFSCTTSNATISGNQITANSSGTVTVKATIKYNSGYSGTTTTSQSTTAHIPVGTILYLKPSTDWASATARYSLYLFKDGGSNKWVDAKSVCNNDGYYEATVPNGAWTKMIWGRMNPATTENNWDNKWNQTGDLTYDSRYDLFTVSNTNDWNGATTTWSKWTTKQPCCNTVTKPTITLVSSPVKCGVDVTAGLITIDGYDANTYTYTLNKNGNATTIAYDKGYAITEEGSYTVTADVSENSCGSQTSDPQEVTVTDNTPTINSFTVTAASDKVCKGSSVTLTATNVNGASYAWYKGTSETPIDGATSYTYSPTITENTTFKVVVTKTNNGCPATADATSTIQVIELPTAPTLNSNSTTVCSGVEFTLPGDYNWYEVSTDGTKLNSATISGGITSNKSYWAEAKNASGCVSSTRTEYTVTVNPTPVITGETFTQPGKENAIELTVPTGNDTKWTVNKNGDLSVATGSSTMFSAENKGTYTITADYNGCTDTHDVTVSDAFYIWVRNAKESDTAYGQFYYPNENSEAVRGGEMFYAECDNLPTNGNTLLDTHYKNYNKGGRKADIVNDDCDGYTWYGFKASADVIAGTKYFYVHATNDLSDGGYYTHSKPLKSALSGDVYYTLGTTGDSYRGWNLSTASAPYAGPVVHASGSTALGSNKFAALYVTDCSGKKIDSYQWEYCGTQDGTYDKYTASVSNSGTLYSGDAGTTNNIRPSVAGYYRCKVTYEDTSTSTATSEPVQVTGEYSYTSSSLPVFVVNTNGKGFPVNDCSGTPSKNADKMKEKVSVDVKIYKAGTMVYDRKARMNYRGSSSLNFLKKSYAFCPGKDNCVEDKGRQDYVKTEKMNMLNVGTAKDKDWVLYAAAPDPSLMRNRLVFDTFRDMTGKWSVNSCYVQLYVDGTYKGIYVLMDKITNNENRVNITHEDGFIVKFDKTDKVDRVGGYEGKLGDEKTFKTTRTGKDDIGTYDTSIDQRFEIEYPEKDDYPSGWSAKVNQIQGMFEAFENALAQGDFATVQKYIDYDSWADWFIISEYVKNVDTYRASNIFVYNGNKIEARPLWDQELSLNNQTNVAHGSNSTTGLMATTGSIYNNGAGDFPAPFWFTGGGANITGGLLSDPCFVQVVKEKWSQYSTGTGALTPDALNAKIKAYTTELGTAADISFNRGTMDCGSCQDGGCYSGGTGYSNSISKSSSIDAMDTWIEYRGNNLTTALNNLTGASFSIQILPSEVVTTPWEPVEIAVSVTPEGYDYTLEYTGEHKLGDIANAIIEEEGDKITYRIPRPWPAGDEQQEGERTDIEYGIKATLNVQDGTTVCGSQAAPSSTGKIILQDEPNEKCD